MSETLEQTRARIAERLRERREDIEQAMMVRVYGVSEPSESVDPEYLHGLRPAVSAALDYALTAIELGEDRAPAVPPALLAQARLAARNGVGVDTVMRRYLAGYGLLGEFLLAEAVGAGLGDGAHSARLLQGQAAILDRLLAAIAEEHGRESATRMASSRQRRLERIKRLLAGERIDAAELNYELEGFHVGIVGSGPATAEVVRKLAAHFDKGWLLVPCHADTLWAWLGSRRRLEPPELGDIVDLARTLASPGAILAFGEPGEGLHGWRLSHRQAKAAIPVSRLARERVVRYVDVALLATVLQDDVMATSLRELYLAPLRDSADDGAALRETLKAYFATGGRASSTAAALGVTRRTVGNRLRTIERRLGGTVESSAAEIQTALRLADLDAAVLASEN